jgi:hypothetical protein
MRTELAGSLPKLCRDVKRASATPRRRAGLLARGMVGPTPAG